MSRPSAFLLLIGVLGAGWFALQKFEIRGLDGLEFVRRSGESTAGDKFIPPAQQGATIRIAAFNLHTYDADKAGRPAILEVLAARDTGI